VAADPIMIERVARAMYERTPKLAPDKDRSRHSARHNDWPEAPKHVRTKYLRHAEAAIKSIEQTHRLVSIETPIAEQTQPPTPLRSP